MIRRTVELAWNVITLPIWLVRLAIVLIDILREKLRRQSE